MQRERMASSNTSGGWSIGKRSSVIRIMGFYDTQYECLLCLRPRASNHIRHPIEIFDKQLIELIRRDKAQTYTELTRAEGGIAAMSHTNAKRLMFNWSDREIVNDSVFPSL